MRVAATSKHQAAVFEFYAWFVENSPETDYGLFFG